MTKWTCGFEANIGSLFYSFQRVLTTAMRRSMGTFELINEFPLILSRVQDDKNPAVWQAQ